MSTRINDPRARRLPPGQRAVEGFPRFGKHLSGGPPPVPDSPVIEVRGAVDRVVEFGVDALRDVPRRELVADFHCVAGWTATDILWEGVSFPVFFAHIVEPVLEPGAVITHVRFRGLDGERSVLRADDAFADDVLLADTMGGQPLSAAHGAPVRLVSPRQYGYMSIKHLCRIEVLTAEPPPRARKPLIDTLLGVHPRARVWEEERHGSAPSWLIRPVYRALQRPMLAKAARSDRRREER